MYEWLKAGFMLRLGSFLYDLTVLAAVISAIAVIVLIVIVVDKFQKPKGGA